MATRDYVKRGKSPRKPTRTTKKQPPKSAFPLKWALLAFVLLTGFGYGLYYLATSEPPAKPAPEKVAPAKSSKPKKEDAIPPKPVEEWSYIEELENKQVAVEANEQEVSSRPYLMQCGAYRSASQADERKAMIAFQGLESHIKTSQGEKGIWYRVVLGPYPLKREAERQRNMLMRAGIEPCAIWYWN
ncbi:SPOR domain-containing protein [Enterovibrio nigricans]|uniref:Cell division protein FtsN n=1 Tax=Enterovibrio nigricans DSM 22720 TaxID=1121868 RepID=A0A1T4U9L1_9GAMM|nr:SPOR domain-containing protein [Enterovibrio nigricans]PKF51548.1 cell division protein [Enterovibrio nigricans]SKA49181.1 cell division protein FtsN [Enterovibrio nigricans DSM 22720]